MTRINIPNSVGLKNFEALFKNNTFDFSDGMAELSFHPSYVGLHPVSLAYYAALADQFAESGIQVTGKINMELSSIPFLQRMGLFRVFGFDDIVQITEHEEAGRFIPLRKIQPTADLKSFIADIDPILHASDDVRDAIKKVFSELIRNVLEHSHAQRGGNVCAVFSKAKSKLRIGISDAGVGILETMQFHHKVANHRDAILLALKPGVTGTTARLGGTPDNAGAGLFITKSIAQATRNHFLIYSGDSYYKLRLTPQGSTIEYHADPLEDAHTIGANIPSFRGTLVGIDLNISDSPVFKDLISNIGDVFQISVKHARKNYYSKIRFT